MFKEIKSVIEKTYVLKDYEFFISRCKRKIDFMDELLENLYKNCKGVEISVSSNDPCIEIYLEVNDFTNNDFKVKYTSTLTINKIIDMFNLQHEFVVDNLYPNRMDAVLDGFSDEAYCMLQYKLDDIVFQYLQLKNYKRLYYADMEEVIPEIQMPEDFIFGSQMTVENAIFRDTWNICPEI